jgi:hypothetical protein
VRERLEQEENPPEALRRKPMALFDHATTSTKDGAK